MDNSSPNNTADNQSKSFRMQQLVLLGLTALSFLIAWLDGFNEFMQAVQNVHAEKGLVLFKSRSHITITLSLVSIVALVLAAIAYRQKQLFNPTKMLICGTVVVSVMTVMSITSLLGFDSWMQEKGYERCTSLDHIQGITRHGATNVVDSAWTPIGKCR